MGKLWVPPCTVSLGPPCLCLLSKGPWFAPPGPGLPEEPFCGAVTGRLLGQNWTGGPFKSCSPLSANPKVSNLFGSFLLSRQVLGCVTDLIISVSISAPSIEYLMGPVNTLPARSQSFFLEALNQREKLNKNNRDQQWRDGNSRNDAGCEYFIHGCSVDYCSFTWLEVPAQTRGPGVDWEGPGPGERPWIGSCRTLAGAVDTVCLRRESSIHSCSKHRAGGAFRASGSKPVSQAQRFRNLPELTQQAGTGCCNSLQDGLVNWGSWSRCCDAIGFYTLPSPPFIVSCCPGVRGVQGIVTGGGKRPG